MVITANEDTAQGASIHFLVTEGNGIVVPTIVYSNSDGIAQVTSWTLIDAGFNELEASGRGIADPADGGPFVGNTVVTHATGKLQFTATAIPPSGGELVVIGDVDIFDETGTMNPNNRTLISNLVGFFNGERGRQTTVWFDRGRGSKCFDAGGCVDSDLATMSGIITAPAGLNLNLENNNSGNKKRYRNIPANVKAIFLWNPTVAFQKGEINEFTMFLIQGGRLILVLEEKDFLGANGINPANRLLQDLGATMRINSDNVDCGTTILSSMSINSAAIIMNGVTELSMNCAVSTTMPKVGASWLFTDISESLVLGGVAIDLQP